LINPKKNSPKQFKIVDSSTHKLVNNKTEAKLALTSNIPDKVDENNQFNI